MTSKLILALAAAVSLATAALPASAGDIQGDAYDCKELWVMRNEIFKANGYCFKSAKAITYFGNGGCQYDSLGDLPLSAQDHQIIGDAKKSAARQGC